MWALVVVALPAGAATGKSDERAAPPRRATEIIVKYKGGARAAEVRQSVAAELVDKLPGQALEVLDPEGPIGDAIEELEADPRVTYAEPNYLYSASSVTPNDPRFSSLWGLQKIGMPDAWGATKGSADVTVAVVDSGVALSHPDIAPNVWTNPGESGSGKENNGIDDDGNGYVDDWRGWDWVDADNRPGDANGHGSHVAGTIAARGNDAYGVTGINWQAGLISLRALDSTGIGSTSDIAEAFAYAGRLGVDVVNASLGGGGNSETLLNAIADSPDTLFVVAAGNDGANNDTTPQYPCNYNLPNVICVAASGQDDSLAGFSNYGTANVDLAAPGVGILSVAPALSQPLREEFETDFAGRWTTGGDNNLWARAVDTEGGYITDSPGIDYLSNTNSWIATAQPFSLARQSDCRVLYSLKLATQQGQDALVVEMSRDGQTWSKVAGWTGSSEGAWISRSEDARAFDGMSSVLMRFRLRSDELTNAAGVDIDDVRIRCISDTYSGSEFRTMSGTSMAAPHVAGVAALLKAAVPNSSVSDLTTALLTGVDGSAALLGKVSTGGRLNAVGSLTALGMSGVGGGSDPVPQPDPSTVPEPDPTTEPDPDPTTEPEPEPVPTIAPEPEPTNDPEPVPTEDPADVVATEHPRRITLKLGGALVASGRINVDTGYVKCSANVPVKIKRNGVLIKRTTTNETGSYRVRVPQRKGRYVAIAVRRSTEDVPAQLCLGDRSAIRRP